MEHIRKDDRVVLSRLDNEDEEYFGKFVNEQGIVTTHPEGIFTCAYVKFDNYDDEEYMYIKNLDKLD